jgi:chaperonin GroES
MGLPRGSGAGSASAGTLFANASKPYVRATCPCAAYQDLIDPQEVEHMATIRPLGDRVLIKRLEAEEQTAGGIVLPDTAKEKPKQGKVIAVGDGRQLESGEKAEFQVKKGDTVLFGSFAGTEVTVDGEEYILMSEDDILAVIS